MTGGQFLREMLLINFLLWALLVMGLVAWRAPSCPPGAAAVTIAGVMLITNCR